MKNNIIFITILFGFFLLVDLIFWANKEKLEAKIPRNKESIWEIRKQQIAKLDAPAEVIFLGDSTVGSAINAEHATQLLGKKVLNLGLTGDLITYGDYKILSDYLEKFSPPKAVVFWHTLDVWSRPLEPFIFTFTNPDLEDLNDYFNNNYKKNPHRYAPVLLENFLVNNLALYRYKISFREIYNGLFKVPTARKSANTIPEFKWAKSDKYAPSVESIFWLKKLVHLCRKHDIKLMAAQSPILKNFYELENLRDFQIGQRQHLGKIYETLSIPVISENYIFIPEQTDEYNMDHINAAGAIQSTLFYMDQVKKHL